ncbi:MAG: CHRD domain-containing protein [Thermoanaerobaculia bacterium]
MKRRLLLLAFAFLALVPTAMFGQTFTATLTGSNEPDGGDTDATGFATVSISGTTVNYLIVANNTSTITNAHIHRGSTSGVVIGFPVAGSNPLTPFIGGVAVGSVGPVDQALINEILANPNAFYVNVHSSEKPGGAVRGNLNGGIGIAGQETASACSTGGDTALCLNGNRFKVETAWKSPDGKTGVGHAVKLTADSGYFWFFNADNAEMIVKSLNACSAFNSQWVFSSGLTNVQVTLKVTDTQTGKTRTYTNPLGAPFQPIQDTAAFACP